MCWAFSNNSPSYFRGSIFPFNRQTFLFRQLQVDVFIDGFFPKIFLLGLLIIVFMFLVQP